MNVLKWNVAIVLALGLTACPSGNVQLSGQGTRVVRPAWVPRPNRSHPDFFYVTGTCRERSSVGRARECAQADAEQQLQQTVGDPTVRLGGKFVEDEYFERREGGGGTIVDAWVLVAFPRKELKKAQTRVANRVLLGVACESDTPETCAGSLTQRVEAALTERGLSPAPERLGGKEVREMPVALQTAARVLAARVLVASFGARFLSSTDGEFYAEARCGFRLVDAVDGKVQASAELGPVKAGHIGRAEAVKKALDECLGQLVARLPRAGS